MITADDIRALIQENVMGVDAMAMREDQSFKEAGVDSLDQINILLAIEEKHGYNPLTKNMLTCMAEVENES